MMGVPLPPPPPGVTLEVMSISATMPFAEEMVTPLVGSTTLAALEILTAMISPLAIRAPSFSSEPSSP